MILDNIMADRKIIENVHWADFSAQKVIDTFPNEKEYTVASGITPSGYIHIGNFREVITTELVRRALVRKEKKTRFIYSWDSYDAFRKVPKDIPQEWSKYLRMPDAFVPNPFGEGSYADEFIKTFEEEVKVFNFPVEFLKQHELQTSGIYADSIMKVMVERKKVIDALNKYRDEPLPDTWMPIDIYDDETGKDTNQIISYDGKYTLEYTNELGKKKKVDFKKEPRVKLRWKADWPMRWAYFKVNFEPGGKDHSTPGSSYTVGCDIVREVFGREPPVYTMYDFVKLKGFGGKISSSKGGALRVKDVLEVYTPEMILFLFAGTRPNAEIDISFDLDVIKIYEDFDKLERLYYGLEEESNDKKYSTLVRAYELSMPNGVEVQKSIPFQPSFRHLLNVAQACGFDGEKIKEFYGKEIKTDFDLRRLQERVVCAKNWLEKYAPEDMKFHFLSFVDSDFIKSLSKKELDALRELREFLAVTDDSKELMGIFKVICDKYKIEPKDLFSVCYKLIIGKEKGPRLAGLMIENKEKVLEILNQVN